MSFWGAEVKHDKLLPFVPPPDFAQLHLTAATLVPDAPQGAKVTVKVKVAEDEFYICSLREGATESVSLDLTFDAYAEFSTRGTEGATVHLAGYVVAHEDEYEEAEEADSDEEELDDPTMDSLVEGEDRERLLEMLESHRKAMDSEDEDSEDYSEEHDSEDDEDFDDRPTQKAQKSSVIIEDITDQQDTLETDKDGKTEDGSDLPPSQKAANGKAALKKMPAKGKAKRGSQGATLGGFEEIELGSELSDESEEEPTDGDDSSLSDLVAAAEDAKEVAGDAVEADADAAKEAKEVKEEPLSNGAEPAAKRKASALDRPAAKKAKTASTAPETAKTKKKKKGAQADAEASAAEGLAVAKGKKSYPNGFTIENMSMGVGGKMAKPGKKVAVKYTGKLAKTGKVFDQTKGNKPFQFRLGVGEVIKGWDQGLVDMRVGDRRRLTVPASMAYGSQGVKPVIPPNATLIFDIELCDVKG